MKEMKSKLFIVSLTITLMAFYSCQKDELSNSEIAAITSEESSVADGLFDDASDQAEINEDASLKSATEDYCTPVITIVYPEDTPYPRVITMDFGAEGCKGKYNRIRKGKIISTVTGRFAEVGSKRIITFENFYVNDYKIEGSRTVTNTGKNEGGNFTRSIEVDGKVITPEGKEITRLSSRVREWIDGHDTPLLFWDDVFSITGTASGVNSRGNNYTAEIILPLIKARNCRWIQEGSIKIVSNETTILLDYGDGTCNNVATATINGEEKEISLKW